MDRTEYYNEYKELVKAFRHWYIDTKDTGAIRSGVFLSVSKNELFLLICALAHAIIDDGDSIKMNDIIKESLKEDTDSDDGR